MRRPRQPFALPGAGEQRRRAGRPEVEAAAVVTQLVARVLQPGTFPQHGPAFHHPDEVGRCVSERDEACPERSSSGGRQPVVSIVLRLSFGAKKHLHSARFVG
jgi:hypothetical protein